MRCLGLLFWAISAPVSQSIALEAATSSLATQYAAALVSKPVETKVASACVLAIAGDALAQSRDPGPYDARRGASFVAFDSIYRGAFQHYAFPAIQQLCSGAAVGTAIGALAGQPPLEDVATAVERTLFNQLVVVPIVYYPLFFLITGALQGLTAEQSTARAAQNFAPLMQRNLLFWLPVQYAQFLYVDLEWQVSYVCAAGLVWNIILSALAGDAAAELTPSDMDVASDVDDVDGGGAEDRDRLTGVVTPSASATRSPSTRDVAVRQRRR